MKRTKIKYEKIFIFFCKMVDNMKKYSYTEKVKQKQICKIKFCERWDI